MELHERIALARKQAGLSQEQLGEKLGVSRQAVSKWESGQTNPDVAYIAEMCRLFGVSSDWLLLGEDGAREAAPARCPGCQAVVTGLDRFCPNCGKSLTEGGDLERGRYVLVLDQISNLNMTRDRLAQFYRELMQGGGTDVILPDRILELFKEKGGDLSSQDADSMLLFPPVVLCRNADCGTARRALKLMEPCARLLTYPNQGDSTASQLVKGTPVAPLSSQKESPPEPLSFGMVVLAVILGVVGALILLSFL